MCADEQALMFPADYTVSCLNTLPSETEPLVFARDGTRPRGILPGSAMLAEVQTGSKMWIGQFQGSGAGRGLCGVYHTPRMDEFCLISHGQAYIGPALEPDRIEVLRACPIVAVLDSAEDAALILASYSDLVIITPEDRWEMRDVASDGIRDLAVERGLICGEAWSAPFDKWVRFRIDMRDHKIQYD